MAIDFDGVSGRLDVPVSALTVFTVAGRVYLDALPGASTSNGAMLGMLCHATQPAGEWSGGIGVNENGRLIGYWFDGGVHTITGATTLSTGQWYAYAVTIVSNGTCRVWLAGVDDGSAAANSIYTGWSSGPVLRFGGSTGVDPNGFFSFLDGKVADIGIWNAELTAAELLAHARGLTPIGIRPGSLIRYVPGIRALADYKTAATLVTSGLAVSDHPRVLYPTRPWTARKPVAGGGGTTITPDSAQLSLSGTAPSRFLQHLVVPAAAALLLSVTAPAVSIATLVTPDAAQIVLSTTAPVALQDHRPAPAAAQLTFSGTAPTRSVAHLLESAAGQLTLSTTAPVALQQHLPAVTSAQLVLSGEAPAREVSHLLAPTTAQLVFSGTAPTRTEDYRPAIAASQLTLTTTAPSLGNDINITPDVGQLALSTTAPTRVVEHLLAPTAGDLTLTGVAPAAVQDHRPSPAAAALALSATAPDVTVDHRPDVGAGSLALTSTAPTVTQAHMASPAAGQLALSGAAPTIGTPVVYEFVEWTNVTVTCASLTTVTVLAASFTTVTVEPTP